MSKTYMRLDERPAPPKEKEKLSFEDMRKHFSHHSSMKHEAQLRAASYVCVVIALIGIASLTVSILFLCKVISIDAGGNDVLRWFGDNITAVSVAVLIASIVQIVSSLIAAKRGFKQEGYVTGLIAYIFMIFSSLWTVILPIVSVILMIYYMKAKGSFFY